MMKLFFTILTLLFSSNAIAQTYKINDGFYTGLDPTKIDDRKANLDKSFNVKEKTPDGKYYGYKFSEGGFFLAPEAIKKSATLQKNTVLQDPNFLQKNDNLNYNVKANLGYDFNKSFSGFVTYDVGNFSYDATQRRTSFVAGQNAEVGVGSQMKFDDFSAKVTYSQQNGYSATNGGQIKSDIIRFGASYNF